MTQRKLLASARHIVVEGPIGVGKTSLARRLAEHLDADTLLEQPEANPFLARFYQNRQRYALQTQLQFAGVNLPPQFIGSMPYILTILVLAGFVGRSRAPAASGVPYEKGG